MELRLRGPNNTSSIAIKEDGLVLDRDNEFTPLNSTRMVPIVRYPFDPE